MSRTHEFAQVDVFSGTPFLGNPVAVVLDADGLSDEMMQRIARWTNLSETTFVCDPVDPAADYRLRIWTPAGELPFAGHPTLGSAAAWRASGGCPSGERIVQECRAGLIEIRRDGDVFSFAAPPTIRGGEVEPELLARIARALRIDESAILSHQWVDNGPGWSVVELASADDVLALEPDLAILPDGMFGAIGAYPPDAEFAYELRTFAPRVGVAEDPVCGSMNASVAQWLTSTGAAPARYRASQGSRVGRAGEITIQRDRAGTVWVGGRCTVAIRGMVRI